ncbi:MULTISPECIES: ABC transporter permease [Acidianus]|uniref:Peptide ABC transporter permease n=1 Tax=Candidatus Acidianus copahuensis TaxID=1160895 RepID=A0A031LNA8_9CREN|nr:MULTISPECIES: ABC transporter permease [Acidianus]EZQ04895.1 peptide ABC transporter permease [Candidatus Acidianus copahuensis]NON62037.1 ABC transporter permease [Acidianus sp. RZ1]
MSDTGGLKFYVKMLSKDVQGLIGLIIVILFFGWGLIEGSLQIIGSLIKDQQLGHILLPSNPFAGNHALVLHPPIISNFAMIMGTNVEGESIFSRILYAIPRDALASVAVVLAGITIGSIIGIISGYLGGMIDEVLMRITDAILSLPALILVIAIAVLTRANYEGALIALIAVWWPTYARFFRAQILKLKNMDFVSASKLYNVSKVRLFFRYLFLNSLDPVFAYAALDFGNVILTYSTLAFLGIGIQPPIPELGEMASNGVANLPYAWWYAIYPSLTILIIVVGFVLVGDRLQDITSGRITY